MIRDPNIILVGISQGTTVQMKKQRKYFKKFSLGKRGCFFITRNSMLMWRLNIYSAVNRHGKEYTILGTCFSLKTHIATPSPLSQVQKGYSVYPRMNKRLLNNGSLIIRLLKRMKRHGVLLYLKLQVI